MPRTVAFGSFVLLLCAFWLSTAAAQESPEKLPGDFDAIHKLIRRGPGESRWMEIQWHPAVWEARQNAAAQGKPLFIWAGSGGAPSAGC
jgi:hypothetical protein